ncbi:MAG: hypothetical protein ABI217_10600, partial [Chthoniobacterales bacterium]
LEPWHEKSYGHCESFMRIMVFMRNDCALPDPAAALVVKTPRFRPRPCLRSFRWILSAAVCGWAAASTHADLASSTSPLHHQDLAAVTSTLSILRGPETFYPVLGVLAAVVSTYILRRRRVVQLEAMAAAER